jgi:hypothetical protein
LDLGEAEVTDAALKDLKALKKLKSLNLHGTKITDAGLNHLAGLTDLRSLDLVFTKVTAAGVRVLQKALPECKIVSGGE